MTKKELYEKADEFKNKNKEINSSSTKPTKGFEGDLRTDFIYSSISLEGSTLSSEDLKRILSDGSEPSKVEGDDVQEILGLVDAFDYMYSIGDAEDSIISVETIKHMHSLIYSKSLLEDAGEYRKVSCNILDTTYPGAKPEDLSHLMEHFINQMNSSKHLLHPLEYAAICHKRIIDIYPFEKGNGHIARLLLNAVLVKEGYGITPIPLESKSEYIHALMTSHREKNPDFDVFNKFIAECVIKAIHS